MNKLRIVLAQINFLLGDIEGNADKIIHYSKQARDEHKADLIVFPELTLTSYPPEDLLLRPNLYVRLEHAIKRLQKEIQGIDVIFGYPDQTTEGLYNKVSLLRNGEIVANYSKQCLPNYSVFDEKRYFKAGNGPTITTIKDIPVALVICEDLWFAEPMAQAAKAGAKLIISINASPFEKSKPVIRQQTMAQRAKEGKLPIVYVNLVGAQDELIFDGGSMVLNQKGEVCYSAPYFKEGLFAVDIELDDEQIKIPNATALPMPNEEERIYHALVLGVRDYIEKNNFPGAIIGLSGGIDSALTLAIAVDAIGKDRVEAIMMPSRYTAEISLTGAKSQVDTMGVKYRVIPIEPIFNAFLNTLQPEFIGKAPDSTEENLQARCRGTLLMALSNKFGKIVLATGNKSEMSVGYSTLYGDMVGGFCVLKDVSKTMVYRLSNYRNKISPVIPEAVIKRAPSAELAANQKDEDTLPPYSILDEILERYIEKDQSFQQIVEAGFNADVVKKVVTLVDHNEYKRRQAPIGVKITSRAFGRDRRYPITSGFKQLFNKNSH
jgi:NAD+ synthase (glutamine-hydrolysing)